jgi:hypothetical protein
MQRLKGTCEVKARKWWNRSGILLEKGHSYTFEIPVGDVWCDSSIVCDASGYELPKLKGWVFLRRVRGAKWFALIGAIGRCARQPMIYAPGGKFIAHKDGELFLFANDVWFMYWNNGGSIKVSVYENELKLNPPVPKSRSQHTQYA